MKSLDNKTLDLALTSSRRLSQVDAEDMEQWGGLPGIDPAATGKALAAILERIVANFALVELVDRLFMESSGNNRHNPGTVRMAAGAIEAIGEYVSLATTAENRALRLPDEFRPAADRLAALKRVKNAAAELVDVYKGEAEYFGDVPLIPWEEARQKLGV